MPRFSISIFFEKILRIIKDKFGMNGILWAAWFGHVESLSILIKAGGNSESKNKNGLSFLHCASTNGHVDVINVCQEVSF